MADALRDDRVALSASGDVLEEFEAIHEVDRGPATCSQRVPRWTKRTDAAKPTRPAISSIDAATTARSRR